MSFTGRGRPPLRRRRQLRPLRAHTTVNGHDGMGSSQRSSSALRAAAHDRDSAHFKSSATETKVRTTVAPTNDWATARVSCPFWRREAAWVSRTTTAKTSGVSGPTRLDVGKERFQFLLGVPQSGLEAVEILDGFDRASTGTLYQLVNGAPGRTGQILSALGRMRVSAHRTLRPGCRDACPQTQAYAPAVELLGALRQHAGGRRDPLIQASISEGSKRRR